MNWVSIAVVGLGNERISLLFFLSGEGNHSLVCLQSSLLSHSIFHWLFSLILIWLCMWLNGMSVEVGVIKSRAPFLAKESALSLPSCPAWALTHFSSTELSLAMEFQMYIVLRTRDDVIL